MDMSSTSQSCFSCLSPPRMYMSLSPSSKKETTAGLSASSSASIANFSLKWFLALSFALLTPVFGVLTLVTVDLEFLKHVVDSEHWASVPLALTGLTFYGIIFSLILYTLSAPSIWQLHKLLLNPPLRYHRSHFSHMRLDRLRHLVHEGATMIFVNGPSGSTIPIVVTQDTTIHNILDFLRAKEYIPKNSLPGEQLRFKAQTRELPNLDCPAVALRRVLDLGTSAHPGALTLAGWVTRSSKPDTRTRLPPGCGTRVQHPFAAPPTHGQLMPCLHPPAIARGAAAVHDADADGLGEVEVREDEGGWEDGIAYVAPRWRAYPIKSSIDGVCQHRQKRRRKQKDTYQPATSPADDAAAQNPPPPLFKRAVERGGWRHEVSAALFAEAYTSCSGRFRGDDVKSSPGPLMCRRRVEHGCRNHRLTVE
ncbi:hypothetical protein BDZ89DRAFT_1198527 [Hymenopellis radicata]|nr:hypothetical protein BDZ89DRAFT_1198527 [Hymenopellis radicata]